MGHFSYKRKNWVILACCEGQNDVICLNLVIIVSLKVPKNYFSQVYGQKCRQKCNLWTQSSQNRSFLVKMEKIG